MPAFPILKSICLRNLLSFGDDAEVVELGPLNVLIGANASGKSNFLEALALLHSIPQGEPRDFGEAIRQGGGIRNWLWKGVKGPVATVEAVIRTPDDHFLAPDEWELLSPSARAEPPIPLRYRIAFREDSSAPQIIDESVADAEPAARSDSPLIYMVHERESLLVKDFDQNARIPKNTVDDSRPFLSQRESYGLSPQVNYVSQVLQSLRLYREWRLGRDALPRCPQLADRRHDFLASDYRNLGHVLNHLRRNGKLKLKMLDYLRRFSDDVSDVDVLVQGGMLQIYLQERSFPEESMPATRLSDGTLRWLCLLAILLHPDPPPLVCLEEPEIGLHPDMMHVLADLLRDAATRMQLVVTTHSEALVDALTATPKAVIVCERPEGSTRMNRLEPESLKIWLERYSLGDLWRSGEIGGTRW